MPSAEARMATQSVSSAADQRNTAARWDLALSLLIALAFCPINPTLTPTSAA